MYRPKPVPALALFERLARPGEIPAFRVVYRSRRGVIELQGGTVIYRRGTKLAERLDRLDTASACRAAILSAVRRSLGLPPTASLTFKGI